MTPNIARSRRALARWTLAIALVAGSRAATAQDSPADSARNSDDARVTRPIPAAGEQIRVFAPTLPALDARLTGAFLGVDSTAGTKTLGVSAKDGVHYIPCSAVDEVDVQRVRRFPLWQKIAWVVGGAYAGLYLGHMVADNPPGTFTAEDPPLPHPEREHAAHRRENRMMIGGTVLGASVAYLAVRDMHRWRAASLGGCQRPQFALLLRPRSQSSQ